MAKTWSFNTTIRNPERMENMLRALSELEGEVFDIHGQEKFFGLQIKKRLYKPTKSTLQEESLINAVYSEDSADDLEDHIVENILQKYRGKSVDGSGRGRTAAGILNRFGLCVALQSKGSVVITELAKKWLNDEIDDDELFSKFFLKWQYPNKIEGGYNNFDIKPFVGTLALIRYVNEKWESLGNTPVGLSKLEYQLFVPSLSRADQIYEYVDKIINFRVTKESLTGVAKTTFIKEFSKERAQEISSREDENIDSILNDLRDYMDSSVRYFRVSNLIILRGNDNYIDIAKDKKVEVESILNKLTLNALEFDSYDSYLEYLNNTEALELPWENYEDLRKINLQLSEVMKTEIGEQETIRYMSEIELLPESKKVKSLEEFLNNFRIYKLRGLRHNIVALDECIERLGNILQKNYNPLTARPSLDLEWYVSRSLMILNDAVKIVPSYNLGDDGIPTGFRANTSDIECYYDSFDMTVEVTLLLGRDQWIAEGQPVMRHFRDFEDKIDNDLAYCIFIAPLIHRDTLNTFWNGNKFGYEGERQNIIPLTLSQFIEILKIAKDKISNGTLDHRSISGLFGIIAGRVDGINLPQEWVSEFPTIISEWS
ncbi:MAG: AlwI family type II restriction endonuclease [bacterium]